MIPEISRIRSELATIEPLLEEMINMYHELKKNYSQLLAAYTSLQIEKDNLQKQYNKLKNGEHNTNDKKS